MTFLRRRVSGLTPERQNEPDGQKNPQGQSYPEELKKRRAQELAGGKAQLLAYPNPGTDIVNIQADGAVARGAAGGQQEQSNQEDAHDDSQPVHDESDVGLLPCPMRLTGCALHGAAFYLLI